ncbi:hypothetical protein YH65_05025 [Sulfurovum lithotrophicum]|uniref:Lipoprotein n=1 Tax=Sulfurovum lithotrophicum TaxID=206403 RepID=A0A7U4RQK0_9BACT|nr:hypothetical protein [Sulfurovum lithotrophicum]AKF24817.1 hypothetical protein YH65_05025 [Sulfurovum lithotrophicum]
MFTRKIMLGTTFLAWILLTGCTPDTLTPVSNADRSYYKGDALILIAVDGDGKRAVRHIEVVTKEEPLGYEIYFHDRKPDKGFIELKIPTPSSNVRLKEYSLSGHYGCSRGKAGYGSGSKIIAKISSGKTYFLGTINTDMNTVYNEMPKALVKEAKKKYNYTAKGEDIPKTSRFQSNLSL